MREIKFVVLPDPSVFTPLQLQPRFLISLGFNAWSRWAEEHFVPFTSMVRDHHFGMVVVGGHVEYLERLSYLDADSGEVRARARARLGGAFVQIEFSGAARQKRFVKGTAVLVPVRLEEMNSFGATPARLTNDLLALFESDEVDPESPEWRVAELVRRIDEEGEAVAESSYPFTVYRHACEMADQWCAAQIPCYVSEARESLAFQGESGDARLRQTLNLPLHYFDMELRSPMYFFDKGTVVTKAFDVGGQIAFVHNILSADTLHGTVVERF
jgi:hypothetical protein